MSRTSNRQLQRSATLKILQHMMQYSVRLQRRARTIAMYAAANEVIRFQAPRLTRNSIGWFLRHRCTYDENPDRSRRPVYSIRIKHAGYGPRSHLPLRHRCHVHMVGLHCGCLQTSPSGGLWYRRCWWLAVWPYWPRVHWRGVLSL